ncbi:MAG: hypothetical protein WAU53_06900 [Rhodoplanes sp.]
MVIAIEPLGIALDVIIKMPLVDSVVGAAGARAVATHHDAVLGGDSRRKRQGIALVVLDVAQLEKHAVDDAEIVAVLETDDFFAAAGRITMGEAARLLHRVVEPDARRVLAAQHLVCVEQTAYPDVASPHLPHELVVLATGDGVSLPRRRGQADDRALGGLPVNLGEKNVGRIAVERAFALDWRKLTRVPRTSTGLPKASRTPDHRC